jgi:hypothetical protein
MNAPDAARSVVSFESSAFNCTEPKQYFINEGCFGDDVAAWFRDELRSRGYAASEPGQEDFGWYLPVEIDGLDYFLLIGYREGTSSERGAWFVVLERHRKWPPLGIASYLQLKRFTAHFRHRPRLAMFDGMPAPILRRAAKTAARPLLPSSEILPA